MLSWKQCFREAGAGNGPAQGTPSTKPASLTAKCVLWATWLQERRPQRARRRGDAEEKGAETGGGGGDANTAQLCAQSKPRECEVGYTRGWADTTGHGSCGKTASYTLCSFSLPGTNTDSRLTL